VAEVGGSELERNPRIKRRISHLRMHQRNGTTPAPTPQTAPTPPPAAPQHVRNLDRVSILDALTEALNGAAAGHKSNEIAAIIREIRAFMPSLLQEKDETLPDPLAVVTYLCTAADKTPSQVRKEMKGMDWIIGRVQALTRCPPAQLLAAAQCVANAVAQREAKRPKR